MAAVSQASNVAVPTPSTGDSSTAIATREFLAASFPLTTRRVIFEASGYMSAGDAAGIWMIPRGQHLVGSGGSFYSIPRIAGSGMISTTVAGKSSARFLEVIVSTNNVAVPGEFIIQLHELLSMSGGDGVVEYTLNGFLSGLASSTVRVLGTANSTQHYTSSNCYDMSSSRYIACVTSSTQLPLGCRIHFDVKLFECRV